MNILKVNIELNNFIYKIVDIANKQQNKLFILKEKKDEYSYIDKKLFEKILKSKNMYLIRSKQPRLLKENGLI